MKLFGGRLSHYFERVVLVLTLKDALGRVELASVPGGLGSAEWKAINPIGKIPALQLDDGRILPESQVIAEYLDQLFPEPALIPADLEAATSVRLICRLIDSYIGQALGPVFKVMREGGKADAASAEAGAGLGQALDMVEYYLDPGSRAVGDDWTLADCALIPILFHVRNFGPMVGLAPFENRPKLERWHASVAATGLYRESEAGMKRSLAEFMARIAAQNKPA